MCTRRNHIDFWSMKKEYKKPGLMMDDFFVILWVFLRMPELKDEPGQPETFLSYPTLLYSSPISVIDLRAGLDETDGLDGMLMRQDDTGMTGGDNMMAMGRDSTRMMSRDDVMMMGRDDTRMMGWDNMTQWHDRIWVRDGRMRKDLKRMILDMKITGRQYCDGRLLGNFLIHQQLKILVGAVGTRTSRGGLGVRGNSDGCASVRIGER